MHGKAAKLSPMSAAIGLSCSFKNINPVIMKLRVAETIDAVAKQVADDLLSQLNGKSHPVVCVASGDSPAGLYRELVRRVQQGEINVDGWWFLGLDEWMGMNGDDEGSCRYHLDRQLFLPLQIAAERICFFNGRAGDAAAECERVEAFIKAQGGIDVAIVGLGLNGHVGMNEPGTPPSLHAHVAAIAPETQQVGQKYFKQQQQLSHGLTLGLANLQEARAVFLLVNGKHKASVVQRAVCEPPSGQLPVSLLRHHHGLAVYLDSEAASLLPANVPLS